MNVEWRRAEPFIGREPELDLLMRCWRESVDNSVVSTVVIRGQGGIGKTSLAAEAVGRLAHEGAVVYVELGEDSGPLSVLAQLRRHLPPQPELPIDATLQASLGARSPAEPTTTRADLIRAGVGLLVALGRVPTAVVIDGLERVDELTAAVLDVLADGQPGPASLLIVGLERDDDRSRLHAGSIIRVLLEPLGVEPVGRWIQAIGSSRVAAEVVREAGGIPLFVALALEQRGDWERRLRAVSARARMTATVAALLGPLAKFDIVRAASSAETLQLLEDVESLHRAGVLVSSPMSDDLVLVHDLARTQVLESLSADRLQRMAALVLTRVDPSSLGPAMTLEICRRAGPYVDVDRLVDAAAAVAQMSIAAFDFPAAKQAIDGTLRLVGRPEHRWPLLAAAFRANLAVGDHDGAESALSELRAAVAAGAPIEIEAQLLQAELNLGTGALPRPDVVERLQVVIAAIGGSSAAVARRLRRRLVLELLNVARVDEAVALVQMMEADARHVDDQADLVPLRHMAALVSADRAGVAAASATAAELHRGSLSPRGRTSLAMYFAGRAVERGEVADLEVLRAEIAEGALAGGEVHAHWWSEALGFAEPFWACDLVRAAEACDRALEFGRARLVRTAPEVWAAQRALLAWVEGTLPDLLPSIRSDDLPVAWRALRALAHVVAGDPDAALRDLRRTDQLLAAGDGGLLRSAAAAFAIEAAHAVGDIEWASVPRRILSDYAGQRCGLAGLVDLGPVDRYLALAEAAVDPAGARARLLRVVDDPSTMSVWRIRAEIDAGGTPDSPLAWRWMSPDGRRPV